MMNDNHHSLDPIDDNCWAALIDSGGFLNDVALPPSDVYWNPYPTAQAQSAGADINLSFSGNTLQAVNECAEYECPRKRGRNDQCSGVKTKACRERMRREKLNERFSELSAVLEPGRPVKSDKIALLGDAIRVVNELRTESQEYKEMNEKLMEEIKTLKAEKNELREEKLVLKADKERFEQQLKARSMPPPHPSFMPPPPHAPLYPSGTNKMAMLPGYGFVPMWQYLPPTARDTAQDHELRPPAA